MTKAKKHEPEVAEVEEVKAMEVPETDDLQEKNQRLRDCLIWIREDVVNGNLNHVERINQALGG